MASLPDRQNNGVTITSAALATVIVVSVIFGSLLTVLVAWLYDKFLQDVPAKPTRSEKENKSSGSLRGFRNRYWKERAVSHRRPNPLLILPDHTDDLDPATVVNNQIEQWTDAYLQPSPAFSHGKVSAVSSTPELRLPQNDNVKSLHVQPSAFKRWSLEAAEALRVSRLSTQAKRRSWRYSWNDGIVDLADWMQDKQKRFSGGFRSSSYYGPETDIFESYTAGSHEPRQA